MATTTATITLSSADLLSDSLSLSSTATLYDAGTTTGLTQYETGRVTVASSDTKVILIDATAAGNDKASKVYIANKNTDEAHYVIISINTTVIGRLYSGDWMFMPWSQTDADADIEVACPAALSTTCSVEYALFHEGKTLVNA
tara:strand:- start:478 stop:906 length:429 start_codon:yes stop_codon:yes gene_type:complete